MALKRGNDTIRICVTNGNRKNGISGSRITTYRNGEKIGSMEYYRRNGFNDLMKKKDLSRPPVKEFLNLMSDTFQCGISYPSDVQYILDHQ